MAINYVEINQRALNQLLSIKKHVSLIDEGLKALVEIRTSQINGCAFCVDLHSNEARSSGVDQQKLDCLPVWRESQLFSDKEMAALAWPESVTNISHEQEMESKLKAVLEKFNEAEVVDLTLIISVMNSLNRKAISFGDKPAKRPHPNIQS